jgi:hypothetical protein
MARSFQQILAEVSAQSDPQRKTVLNQIADLPNQQVAQESALGAQKDQAYEDIVNGARRRGMGFSGIPLGEQAKYNATEYAPALANLKTGFNNSRTTLQSSLADMGKNDYSTAYDMFNQDRSFAEQQRQFNAQLAESRRQSSLNPGNYIPPIDLGSGGNQSKGTQAVMSQRKGGGFNFSVGGKSVSAATYAKAKNIDFRSLLSTMAKAGDLGAKQALGFVGNDLRYDPRKLNSSNANIYNALVWGLLPNAVLPKQAKRPATYGVTAGKVDYGALGKSLVAQYTKGLK